MYMHVHIVYVNCNLYSACVTSSLIVQMNEIVLHVEAYCVNEIAVEATPDTLPAIKHLQTDVNTVSWKPCSHEAMLLH